MNRSTACLLVVLPMVLSACGLSSKPASAIPGATALSTVPGLTFTCRLPVVQPLSAGSALFQTAFVDFPNRTVTLDGKGAFEQHNELYTSVALPHLTGLSWPSWDRSFSRWVPAERDAISPDGARYAYAIAGSDYPKTNLHPLIHLVDIATGADSIIRLPALDPFVTWGVASFTTEGIFLRKLPYEGISPPGLWLLDSTTGSVQLAARDSALGAPRAGAVWVNSLDPADAGALPDAYSGTLLPNEVIRQDLKSGAKAVWFYRPGKSVHLLGLDQSGHAYVLVATGQSSADGVELWLVPAPGSNQRLWSGSQASDLSTLVADAHAVWFSGPAGIFMYTALGGFQKIPVVSGQIAGQCS
ncbi:MAG TPA: hypothetical protein VIJ03_10760 [Candidatus Dormibacteraeota bacterium]